MDYSKIFKLNKEQSIAGRYITLKHIEPLLTNSKRVTCTSIIGYSVLGKPIYKYNIGTGKVKVLMWSQMHGNESTTTKALFDMFNFLDTDHEYASFIKDSFTILIVPILNPDGAERYTRQNANEIDLNRDAQNLSQPESVVLRNLFNNFAPNFCYNLHDQRTIYGVEGTSLPATVSFLAPAFDEARCFNQTRNTVISVICKLNEELQKHIPNQVGRYDDAFNINCVGDTFQLAGVPTILFEAGHYQNDYQRDGTRKYIFIALLASFKAMGEKDIEDAFENYLTIPLNKINFLDILYKNVKVHYDNKIKTINFAAQYREDLVDNEIGFSAMLCQIDDFNNKFGHLEYDLENEIFDENLINLLNIGQEANFISKKGTKFVNGLRML